MLCSVVERAGRGRQGKKCGEKYEVVLVVEILLL